MVQGSVIEVATWRGVGRPDSRTSRLMLGMGTGNVNEESKSNEGESHSGSGQKQPQKPAGFAGVIFTVRRFLTNFNRIKWGSTLKALIAALAAKREKRSKEAPKSAGVAEDSPMPKVAAVAPGVTVSRASDDADIEAWLNSITAKATRESTKPQKSSTTPKLAPKSKAKAKSPAKKSASKPTPTRRSK